MRILGIEEEKTMRRTVLLLLFTMLMSSLVFVGHVAAAPTTLKVWESELTDPDSVKIFDRLNAEFEKANPNVKLEFTMMAREDSDTLLRVALASGKGPDVANTDIGDAFLGALVSAGFVHDMTADYKSRGWDKRIFEWAMHEVTLDGKVWAVPMEQEAQGLWYNRALFKKMGWPVPNTWANLMSAAKSAKNAGYIAISQGTKTLATAPQLLADIVYGMIPKKIVNDASTLVGKTTWRDDPRFLQAVKIYVKMNQDGWLPPDPNSLDHGAYVQIFLQGKAAMGNIGPWNAGNCIAAWKDGVMEPIFIPFPAQDTSFPLQNEGAAGGSVFVSNAATPANIKLGLDWIEYTSIRAESQKIWLFEHGTFPITREKIDPATFPSEALRSVWDAISYIGERGGVAGIWLDHSVSPEASEVFNVGQQRLLANVWTPEEFIKQFSDATIAARKAKK